MKTGALLLLKSSINLLTTGIILSPSGTGRDPPGIKSFWGSTTRSVFDVKSMIKRPPRCLLVIIIIILYHEDMLFSVSIERPGCL
jgi:hypothetical protein